MLYLNIGLTEMESMQPVNNAANKNFDEEYDKDANPCCEYNAAWLYYLIWTL